MEHILKPGHTREDYFSKNILLRKDKFYKVELAIDEDGNLIDLNNGIFVNNCRSWRLRLVSFNVEQPTFLTNDGQTILISEVVLHNEKGTLSECKNIEFFKAPPLSYYREQKIKNLL